MYQRRYRGTDPDPDPFIIKQTSKENLDFYLLFCDFLKHFLPVKNDVNIPSKSNEQKLRIFCSHLEGHWRKEPDSEPDLLESEVRIRGSGSVKNVTDPKTAWYWFVAPQVKKMRATAIKISSLIICRVGSRSGPFRATRYALPGILKELLSHLL